MTAVADARGPNVKVRTIAPLSRRPANAQLAVGSTGCIGTSSTKAGANLAADSSHLSGHLPAALDRLD
jgi:hypothetical protein